MQGNSRVKQFLAVVLALLFLCGGQRAFALDLAGLFQIPKTEVKELPSRLKMYAKTEKVLPKMDAKSIFCPKGEEKNAYALYDDNAQTVCGSENGLWVTLDLGLAQRICAVQILPSAQKEHQADRLIGTGFYASNDNKTFVPVGTIAPVSGSMQTARQEITFGGMGEYRYVRVELPAGAYLAELSWMAYTEWNFTPSKESGKEDMSLTLYAYDAPKEMDTTILTAIYSKDGILKNYAASRQDLAPKTEQSVAVAVPNLKRETGDSYRIMVFDSSGGQPLERPLEYRDNGAAQNFSVPNLFSDHMLLQAEKPLTVWGKAPKGSRVTVTLANSLGGKADQTAVADAISAWEVNLGTFSAGGDYTLTVRCGKEKRIYRDITFGDVWLCIGQSNMDYYMLAGEDTKADLDSARGRQEVVNPGIRLLNLWNLGTGGAGAATENLPLAANAAAWASMNRDAANYCSAIGYYFAQSLWQEYRTPIGIIGAAVGDTEINRWIPREEKCGSFVPTDGGLFYNRIAPLSKLQIRGILMYQGEADEYRTHLTTIEYRDAMTAVVDSYRRIFGEDLPFYWAQLTRYKADESAVREGQRLALSCIKNPKNAGVISLIDLYGEYEGGAGNCREDIHPHQKREVAERFLRLAKRDVYGDMDTSAVGPFYTGMRVSGSKMELTFSCVGSLTLLPTARYADQKGEAWIKEENMDPKRPQEFELCGADGVFYPAEAELRGDRVILTCDKVKKPVAARYAWGAYPEMPNLTDASGLPALAFMTAAPGEK